MNADALQRLVDRVEIIETVQRYATGLDATDWELYRSIFTDEIDVDFASFNGGEPRRMAADDWVESLRPLFSGLDATQHVLTQPSVDIAGDRATCTVYMQAEHFFQNDRGDDSFTLGGFYTDRLVRVGGGWKVCAVTLTVWWSRGNRGIMSMAAAKGAEALEGA